MVARAVLACIVVAFVVVHTPKNAVQPQSAAKDTTQVRPVPGDTTKKIDVDRIITTPMGYVLHGWSMAECVRPAERRVYRGEVECESSPLLNRKSQTSGIDSCLAHSAQLLT